LHFTAAWPIEAVRMHLPPRRWAEPFLEAAVKCKAVVVGPGLGTDPDTAEEIRAVVAGAPVPVVIDADALTALGDAGAARQLIARRSAPAVLTPHDGEYARLAGRPPGTDRLDAARALAAATGAVVLLKGALTAVASSVDTGPDVLLSGAGRPSLATAGSGDVLSGIIGAFLARGVPAPEAAALGAHLHGRAAALGPAQGLVAGDLPELLVQLLAELAVSGVAADTDRTDPPRCGAGRTDTGLHAGG
jgi:hydroxyethylthiazole kinase-like uncharacterized protein yjeF